MQKPSSFGNSFEFQQPYAAASSSLRGRVTPVIVPLSVQALDDVTYIEKCSNPIAWSREQLLAEFNSSLSSYFGARLHGRLVGFALFQVCLDEGHLLSIGVLPELRGQGVGGQLLVESLREIHEGGARSVYLEVRKSNAIAIRLYKQIGFCEVQERPRYYYNNGEDALVMSLSLTSFLRRPGVE